MNTIQTTSQHSSSNARRASHAIAAAAILITLGTLPAAARPDPGPANPQVSEPYRCAIQRVGTQYVGCDYLTGNGVPAPAWVDER